MAYKLTLGEGDKVIVFINGKWIEGEVKEVQNYNYFNSDEKDRFITVQADRYRMITFPGDRDYKESPNYHHTVIKKVS